MSPKTVFLTAVLVVALFGGFNVAPAEDGPLVSTMESFKIVENDGKEVREAAERVMPGEVIEYVISQKNVSEGTLSDIKVVGPVPEGTHYLVETATAGSGLRFSADKGQTFGEAPLQRTIRLADGTEKEEVVSPEEYTHVQWTIEELKPQAEAKFVFRVKVK
jgi:uncharacterized repeat protein (TIGR01451 family)